MKTHVLNLLPARYARENDLHKRLFVKMPWATHGEEANETSLKYRHTLSVQYGDGDAREVCISCLEDNLKAVVGILMENFS